MLTCCLLRARWWTIFSSSARGRPQKECRDTTQGVPVSFAPRSRGILQCLFVCAHGGGHRTGTPRGIGHHSATTLLCHHPSTLAVHLQSNTSAVHAKVMRCSYHAACCLTGNNRSAWPAVCAIRKAGCFAGALPSVGSHAGGIMNPVLPTRPACLAGMGHSIVAVFSVVPAPEPERRQSARSTRIDRSHRGR